MSPFLEPYREPLFALCRTYRVRWLRLFGSALEPARMTTASDIDFIVDIDAEDPFEYWDLYTALHEELETLFGRSVDLVEHRARLSPGVREEITETSELTYGSAGTPASA